MITDFYAKYIAQELTRRFASDSVQKLNAEAWRAYDAVSRDIDRQKDNLLDEIGRRLSQNPRIETLFTMRWGIG